MIEREDRVLDADPQEARILGWPPRERSISIANRSGLTRFPWKNATGLPIDLVVIRWLSERWLSTLAELIKINGKNYSWPKRIIFSYYIVIYSIVVKLIEIVDRKICKRKGEKKIGRFTWIIWTLKSYIIDRDLFANILPSIPCQYNNNSSGDGIIIK